MGRNAGREKRERKVILATTAVVAAPNAVAAAGATPTKAEYDVLVALANETKSDFNNLINALRG